MGIAAYVFAQFAVFRWGHLGGTSSWRWLWAFVPLVPAAWIVVSIVLRAMQLDEYQVKLLFKGLAVGFPVAMLAAATLGMLGIAGLDIPYAGWIVFAAGAAAWQTTNVITGAAWQL